jgi:NDP-sugar pyrophosphorylase family protein
VVKRAVILAGGRGTRLLPYTSVLPKPLMPVGDRSILEIVLSQLSAAGIKQVTLCVGYLSHLIRAVLDDRVNGFVDIDYVQEDRPLGTGAPLRLVEGLDDTFIVMNGDVLTTLDFNDLVRHHSAHGADVTIATHERKVKIDYGIVVVDGENRIVGFDEKPEFRADVSMGIYVMEPSVLDHIPDTGYADFPDLMQALLKAGRPVSSYRHDGLWFDIGRKDDFEQAIVAWSENGDGAASRVAAITTVDDDDAKAKEITRLAGRTEPVG